MEREKVERDLGHPHEIDTVYEDKPYTNTSTTLHANQEKCIYECQLMHLKQKFSLMIQTLFARPANTVDGCGSTSIHLMTTNSCKLEAKKREGPANKIPKIYWT